MCCFKFELCQNFDPQIAQLKGLSPECDCIFFHEVGEWENFATQINSCIPACVRI